MPVIVDFKVQLLCQTCSSFRRGRRHFKPFAGPVAFTQDRVRTRDYASSAVLSTADNTHTTNTRPLQEQLRDQMDLYKLQRAGLPEDAQIESPKTPSKRKLKASKDQAFDSKAKQPGRPAGNTKKRRASRSTQPAGRTAVQGRKRVADSDQAVTDPAAQGASLKPNTTRPRTLSKQEDTALCSAIKASRQHLGCCAVANHAACVATYSSDVGQDLRARFVACIVATPWAFWIRRL